MNQRPAGPDGPVHPSPPPPLFAPLTSLVPIETNVSTDAPLVEAPAAAQDLPPPAAPPNGSHGFNGSYCIPAPNDSETRLRHDGWKHERRAIRELLDGQYQGRTRLARWDGCGAAAMLYWHKSGQHVLCLCYCCHDRFCWPCGKSRSRVIFENLSSKINKARTRFLTLTVTSDQTPLSDQITRLYRCFKTLRADSWWDKHVTGGCCFLEVTLNPRTHLWHPHLHPIVEGQYIPQDTLSRKWLAITGNSPIVHVKLVPESKVICNYVAKYASKSFDASVFANRDKLGELIVAMAGRRNCLTFGNWRGWKLLDRKPMDMSEYKSAGSLDQIVKQAAFGDAFAVRTLNGLRRNLKWEALNPDAYADALEDVGLA